MCGTEVFHSLPIDKRLEIEIDSCLIQKENDQINALHVSSFHWRETGGSASIVVFAAWLATHAR